MKINKPIVEGYKSWLDEVRRANPKKAKKIQYLLHADHYIEIK